jgi:tRNA A37 threonylcarbamoyltransferase TsaD
VNHPGRIFANVLPTRTRRRSWRSYRSGHTSLVMPEWGVYRDGRDADTRPASVRQGRQRCSAIWRRSPQLAETGTSAIDFPRDDAPGDYAFSSGLKTAVINHLRHEREAGRDIDVPDLAASFQQAIIDVQVSKAVRAVEETGATTFCLAGGVSANPALRAALTEAMGVLGVHVSVPPLELCTDNAAMIAAAAHYRYQRGERLGLDAEPVASLRLDAG